MTMQHITIYLASQTRKFYYNKTQEYIYPKQKRLYLKHSDLTLFMWMQWIKGNSFIQEQQ